MTRYEYDDSGQMVASTTTTEPEWSELDYAEMQALSIYEASLCPGCSRPVDICAADHKAGRSFMVDKYVCTMSLAREVQQRMDEWEAADPAKRGEPPIDARWHDGLMYSPRPATAEELSASDDAPFDITR